MKTVCVSTYCDWDNYGSMLQTLGMKNCLKSMGYESFAVKDSPAPALTYKTSMRLSKNPKACFMGVYRYLVRKKVAKKYSNTIKFMNENIDMKYYDNYDVLKNNPPKADLYVAGSDQIWRFRVCRPVFFLDFIDEGQKRIAYAASMGITDIPEKNKELFKDLVNKFDYISVREGDNKEAISQYTDKDISVNIDPALLCDKEEWRKYQKPYEMKKPYVLVYAIYWDSKLNKKLKELHKKTGLDIVCIGGKGFENIYANKRIFDASPEEFLYLVDNAQAVVTSSFHGTVFSIIFNKKLCAVINPASPSRIEYLLSLLKVKNSTVENLLDTDIGFYDETREIIKRETQKSKDYLRKAFGENE